jgi:site-specific DNA-methyltransferase (adenine-specific)
MCSQLVWGDCFDELAKVAAASVDLIYLDPPFNTNARRRTQDATYDDTFGPASDYIAYMRPRVEEMRRTLAPDGSLFFHCDWRMSHHVRVMLDEVFDVTQDARRKMNASTVLRPASGIFVNEIIWHYGLGASKARRHLLTKHDVIFWYANGPSYTFNLIREGPTEAMLAKYRHTDADGNRYMMSYGKRYTLKGGKPLDDVWDIPAIAPTSTERAGYPTQKPQALLGRIIQLASNEGDVVLDPFCGSGTTLVAAQQLGRTWIGMDTNRRAVEIARRRLAKMAACD